MKNHISDFLEKKGLKGTDAKAAVPLFKII